MIWWVLQGHIVLAFVNLVGGLEHFLFFPYIGNVIIPTDELIVFRGVGRYTTNQYYIQYDETVILMKMVLVYLLYPMVISNIYIYISCINGWTNPTSFFFSWDDPPGISQDIAEPCCKNPRSWGVTWSGRNGPGWYVDLICPCICIYI